MTLARPFVPIPHPVRLIVAVVALMLQSLGVNAQSTTVCSRTSGDASGGHLIKPLADVRWEGSGGFRSAVLEGDPGNVGMYTMVVKLADGFWIAPHWHPETKRVVVLSGTLLMGSGAAFGKAAAKALPQGGFSLVPPRHVHFEGAKGETVVLFTGCGPLATTFVDSTGATKRSANERQ